MTAQSTNDKLFTSTGSKTPSAQDNATGGARLQPLVVAKPNHNRRQRSQQDKGNKKLRPRDAPTTGWRSALTDQLVAIGKPNWAPKPSAEEMRQRRVAYLTNAVWSLTDSTDRFVCAILNRKGGSGKTPLTSYLSCLYAFLTGGEVTFYDGNPGSGASSQIMAMYSIDGDGVMPEWAQLTPDMPGMYRETVSVLSMRKFLAQHQDEMVARDLFNLVRQNHYGVSTVVAHQRPKSQEEHFSATMIRETLVPLVENSRLTFVDTGNDATSPSQLEIASTSSVMAFVAAVDKPASLNDLRQHIGILRDHGYGHKVDAATVVLLGIPEGENVDSYRHHAGDHPGPVLGVPEDEQMMLCRPVMLDRLRQETRDALLEVLVSLLSQNLRSSQTSADSARNLLTDKEQRS